jgi:FtsP/CotA-like multicopper oxidase with cupredoxin domain
MNKFKSMISSAGLLGCLALYACGDSNQDSSESQIQEKAIDSPAVISNPPQLKANAAGEHELIIAYKTQQLFDPETGENDALHLRGYLTKPELWNSRNADGSVSDILVGPQIRAKQGESLKIHLVNHLPAESAATCPDSVNNINQGHCFNTANLHTHGLWVSPQGNSDNVFLILKPKEDFHYEFKIEPNHPAGTFWYHSHVHGSTAIQVSSGMAGPLIIEGERKPAVSDGQVTQHGDLDILWKNPSSSNDDHEKIMVFQQIQYSEDCDPALTPTDDSPCIYALEDYSRLDIPNSWATENRFTSINGKMQGEIKANQNQYHRWRMIHGGIRDTIGLTIKELPDSQAFTAEQTVAACSEYQGKAMASQFKALKTLPLYTIAQDGLTMGQVQKQGIEIFQPGYRLDAMLSFPSLNKYCVYDAKLNLEDEINTAQSNSLLRSAAGKILNTQLLGWVNVQATTLPEQTPYAFLAGQAERIGLASEIIQQVTTGDLSAFTAHASLMTPEVDEMLKGMAKQITNFDILFNTDGSVKFGLRHEDNGTLIGFGDAYHGEDHTHHTYVRKLPIGKTQEWELSSNLANHPFHIHVNPFQIVKILNADGTDVSAIGSSDKDSAGNIDSQYHGLKGVWKDTLLIKQGYKIFVRSKYEKFEGDFVLHCHILDHEDQGMMETVRICGDQYDCNAEPPSHHAPMDSGMDMDMSASDVSSASDSSAHSH